MPHSAAKAVVATFCGEISRIVPFWNSICTRIFSCFPAHGVWPSGKGPDDLLWGQGFKSSSRNLFDSFVGVGHRSGPRPLFERIRSHRRCNVNIVHYACFGERESKVKPQKIVGFPQPLGPSGTCLLRRWIFISWPYSGSLHTPPWQFISKQLWGTVFNCRNDIFTFWPECLNVKGWWLT